MRTWPLLATRGQNDDQWHARSVPLFLLNIVDWRWFVVWGVPRTWSEDWSSTFDMFCKYEYGLPSGKSTVWYGQLSVYDHVTYRCINHKKVILCHSKLLNYQRMTLLFDRYLNCCEGLSWFVSCHASCFATGEWLLHSGYSGDRTQTLSKTCGHVLIICWWFHIFTVLFFSDTWDDWTKYDEMAKELFGMGLKPLAMVNNWNKTNH